MVASNFEIISSDSGADVSLEIVPLYENAELAGILARLSLNEEIPEELYRVIAEILAFAFHIRGRTPGDARPEENNPSMDQGT